MSGVWTVMTNRSINSVQCVVNLTSWLAWCVRHNTIGSGHLDRHVNDDTGVCKTRIESYWLYPSKLDRFDPFSLRWLLSIPLNRRRNNNKSLLFLTFHHFSLLYRPLHFKLSPWKSYPFLFSGSTRVFLVESCPPVSGLFVFVCISCESFLNVELMREPWSTSKWSGSHPSPYLLLLHFC